MTTSQKWLAFGVVLVIIVVIACTGAFWNSSHQPSPVMNSPQSPSATTTTTASQSSTPPADTTGTITVRGRYFVADPGEPVGSQFVVDVADQAKIPTGGPSGQQGSFCFTNDDAAMSALATMQGKEVTIVINSYVPLTRAVEGCNEATFVRIVS